jgi:hypothetical protein
MAWQLRDDHTSKSALCHIVSSMAGRLLHSRSGPGIPPSAIWFDFKISHEQSLPRSWFAVPYDIGNNATRNWRKGPLAVRRASTASKEIL